MQEASVRWISTFIIPEKKKKYELVLMKQKPEL